MVLSFIIPVYDVENYVEKCLDSLTSQNIPTEEYEIVIIDDGSTDNSSKFVKDWISKNNGININLISQKNSGLSASRNVGINNAKGDYIWFVDSDDYIFPYVLRNLLDEILHNNLDVLWFSHQTVNTNGEILPLPEEDDKSNISEKVLSGKVFLTENFKNSCMAWAFIIKRNLLLSENLRFLEGIYFEDIVFTPQMIYSAQRVKFSPIKAYNYLLRNNSIMRDSKNAKKRIMDSLIVVKSLINFAKTKNDPKLSKYIDIFAGGILLYNYRLTLSFGDRKFLKIFKDKMRTDQLYPFKIKQPIQRKILAKIANISPFVFEKLSKLRPVN